MTLSGLISLSWFFLGIIAAIAGRSFIEVCACFLICGIFEGCHELHEIKEELGDWEDDTF